MSRSKRNYDKHTSAAVAEDNIIGHMRQYGITRPDKCIRLSSIGYAAFPGYDFQWPQGAALAVARIVHSMERRGVLRYHSDDWCRGYYLAQQRQEG